MARNTKQAIDEILATLYMNDVRGYQVIDENVLRNDIVKRIQRKIATLDEKARKEVQNDVNYRIERFKEFSHLSDSIRTEVVKIAKERAITLEEAYEVSQKEREN